MIGNGLTTENFGRVFTDLVWLTTCLSNLSNYDVSVNVPVYFWISLYSDKAMFLTVVKPMPCSTCSNYSLKLIGLYPNNLFNTLVPPKF